MPMTLATNGFECHRGSPYTIIRTFFPALTSIASLALSVPSRSTDKCRIPRVVTTSDPLLRWWPLEANLELELRLLDGRLFIQLIGIVDEVEPSLTSRNARAENAVRSPCVIVPTKSGGRIIVTHPVSELAMSRK